jgi:signal transduction histidine kinase
VIYAVWNGQSREVRVGSVMMRNALISVDIPAADDLFDAPIKTPRELLLFDPQAKVFRRVKVRGQIIYAGETQIFLQDDGMGIQLMPSEAANFRAGDLIEAVGYPNISRTALVLRDAVLRKTGEAPLPDPKSLSVSDLTKDDLNSTRVCIQGQLLGWHFEQRAPVLEMQSGTHLYLARLAHAGPFSLRVGSELALDGVYVSRAQNQMFDTGVDSFELLMNSTADIKILSQPSLWTLQRLLLLVGLLLMILLFTAIWIKQLRRLVEQRTTQLQREIRERERVERQHEIEAERSRIARDLHDELGTGLTEVSLLSSAGLDEFQVEDKMFDRFRIIAEKARALVSGLDVIVWAIDPQRNSLESFTDYIGSYAKELLSASNIYCQLDIPIECEAITLPGHVRHNLFLAVKEALNNVIRHAAATDVALGIKYGNNQLEIVISDNGLGFDGNMIRHGNGLTNLDARLKVLHGDCQIKSQPGQGTTVKFSVPLTDAPE